MPKSHLYRLVAGALLIATHASATAGTRVLYTPTAASVGTPTESLQALAVIRGPIDQRHDAGWPCSTPSLPYSPVSSYTLTGRQLTIRCPDGAEHQFLFGQIGIAVQRDGCSMFEWPCNVRVPIEPYLVIWSGNRRFVIFFNSNDEAWARSVANAFWSLGNARPIRDPAADGEFRGRIEAARGGADRTEERRRTQVQAETLVTASRLAEAAALYRTELEQSPDWTQGRYNLALVYGMLELLPEAISEMRRYLHLAPDAPDARAARDQIYGWEALLPPGWNQPQATATSAQ